MPGTIICGVQGDGDLATAGFAASLAKRLRSRLVLLHAAESAGGAADGALAAAEDVALAHLAADRVEVRVESGETAERLRSAAEAAELTIVGSTRAGMLREALHGSVTADVTREPPGPVAVVPAGCDPSVVPETVVCGVRDRSDSTTVAVAARLAERLGAALALVHVISPAIAAASAPVLAMPPDAQLYEHAEQELRELAAAHGDGLQEPPRIEVRLGPVGHELTEAATAAGHALLALGGSARRPMSAAIAGEPTRFAVRHGRCPVLVSPHDPVGGRD
jgi:nucleotide-binding universal stress UspA family protein